MLGSIKGSVEKLLVPVVKVFDRVNITPNLLTVLGVCFSVVSFCFFSGGKLLPAGIALTLSGICDMLDGATARFSGKTSPSGAFLDSFLDRYSDFFPLAGIVVYGASTDNNLLVLLSLFSIMGSFATSYARARAESLGADCKKALAERPERIILLIAGTFLNQLPVFLFILAVVSNVSALQRLKCAVSQLS